MCIEKLVGDAWFWLQGQDRPVSVKLGRPARGLGWLAMAAVCRLHLSRVCQLVQTVPRHEVVQSYGY